MRQIRLLNSIVNSDKRYFTKCYVITDKKKSLITTVIKLYETL